MNVTAEAQPGAQVIEVIAKVESHDSVPNLEEIVEASDAVMVARGDLGAHPVREAYDTPPPPPPPPTCVRSRCAYSQTCMSSSRRSGPISFCCGCL